MARRASLATSMAFGNRLSTHWPTVLPVATGISVLRRPASLSKASLLESFDTLTRSFAAMVEG